MKICADVVPFPQTDTVGVGAATPRCKNIKSLQSPSFRRSVRNLPKSLGKIDKMLHPCCQSDELSGSVGVGLHPCELGSSPVPLTLGSRRQAHPRRDLVPGAIVSRPVERSIARTCDRATRPTECSAR